jgi:hypothetical protein
MKEKHLKGFQKLKKAKREKETHKCVSSRCEVLGMGEVESLRGMKLWTEERFSARDIMFLAEEFNISRFNILRGKPQLWNTLKELKACITKEKGVERVVLQSDEVLTCLEATNDHAMCKYTQKVTISNECYKKSLIPLLS